MTDEKKEILWPQIYRKDYGDYIDIFETNVDQDLRGTTGWEKGYFLTEAQARELWWACQILTEWENQIINDTLYKATQDLKLAFSLLKKGIGE